MRVTAEEARQLCLAALRTCGTPEANARLQTELLVEAELAGHASHGLQRLPRIIERISNGLVNPSATGLHIWQTPSRLDVDGETGLGPVVLWRALEEAGRRAAKAGVVLGAIRNSNHIGMLSWYVRQLAEQGKICLLLTTSEALVHPWGGRAAMLGTNPVAVGIPARPHPFVLDMASGLVSMGRIHDHAHRGAPIPVGWALDAAGNPTTDAAAAKEGSIAPFGGAKGYGLGLAIELLVVALTGSGLGTEVRGTLDSEHICNKGDVFIVIDGMRSGPQIDAYLDALRACPPADSQSPVMVPGDRAVRARAERLISGIDVNEAVWRRIEALTQSAKKAQ